MHESNQGAFLERGYQWGLSRTNYDYRDADDDESENHRQYAIPPAAMDFGMDLDHGDGCSSRVYAHRFCLRMSF